MSSSALKLLDFEHASSFDSQPFVGQHIVADIELRHRHPIADEQVSLPDFSGFDVLEQYVERRTVETRGDEPSWRITAWRYHLFAQRSGELDRRRSKLERNLDSVAHSTFDLRQALATPFPACQTADGNTHWWLPATDVSLSDKWSKDPRELSAGDEILRTITLSARDVLANHLPDIVPPESRALTTYANRTIPLPAVDGDHVTATAIFEFRMIAQSPIPVFLDTVRVPWFSTVDNVAREAIIPARRINVGLPDRADLLASLALEE